MSVDGGRDWTLDGLGKILVAVEPCGSIWASWSGRESGLRLQPLECGYHRLVAVPLSRGFLVVLAAFLLLGGGSAAGRWRRCCFFAVNLAPVLGFVDVYYIAYSWGPTTSSTWGAWGRLFCSVAC